MRGRLAWQLADWSVCFAANVKRAVFVVNVTSVTATGAATAHPCNLSSIKVLLAAFVFGIATQSFAITYIVPPDRFEIERAGAIVVGRVLVSRVEASRFGMETVTTIALEEAIKGNPGAVIDIRTPGGTLDGETRLVPGVPAFAEGERILLFLFQRSDGAFVISDLGLGTFRLVRDAAGRDLAVRNDADIEGWDAGGNVHIEQQRSAERFLDYVRGVVHGDVVVEDYVVSKMPSMVKTESLHPIATASFTATSYMLTYGTGLGTRWKVFPSAVSWNRGNSETGPLGNGAGEISAAFSTWNAGGTNYVLSSANANPNGFLDATDGTNNIVFEKNLTSPGLQPRPPPAAVARPLPGPLPRLWRRRARPLARGRAAPALGRFPPLRPFPSRGRCPPRGRFRSAHRFCFAGSSSFARCSRFTGSSGFGGPAAGRCETRLESAPGCGPARSVCPARDRATSPDRRRRPE